MSSASASAHSAVNPPSDSPPRPAAQTQLLNREPFSGSTAVGGRRAKSASLTSELTWSRSDSLAFAIIGVLSVLTRFIGLSTHTASGTPVFDEKHYVPQAYDQLRSIHGQLGLLAGGGIESNPGYGLVVHPPLGKRLTALSEAVFGYSPLGWRVMAAVFGSVLVLVIMALARRISRSLRVAIFAGILALVDGVLLVISRFGMLDIYLVFFVLCACYAFIRDREQVARLARIPGPPPLRFGLRPWLITCGLFFGLALSVKWSGLYYMAFFGVVTVWWDAWVRAGAGDKKAVVRTLLRDAPKAFVYLVIIPVLCYIFSWRGWFAAETSSFRHAAEEGKIEDGAWYASLPDTLASWVYYHDKMLSFHSSLTNSNGHEHPWESKPLSWLAALRPVLFYSNTDIACGDSTCRRMIFLYGTPIIWWLTVPVLVWAIVQFFLRGRGAYLMVLLGFGAGYIPWLLSYDRQMYFFYAAPLIPFIIIGLALILNQMWGRGPTLRRHASDGTGFAAKLRVHTWHIGSVAAVAYLSAAVVCFAVYSPILYGMLISDDYYFTIMWLRSWR
ncbi:putative dolichyl-phosphate-mannose--protein mannosyltransferase [Corynebacterium ciconiae DSM 44920]|uniref:dolichyl-phosphate-mannose--protein mannosyltransferase n=1 Tax=Corynebacterium ciconiae TaxID=227319 RepID=UPI00036B93C5|nr:phospholipid carrier-dependent glycosyltransferase [Corynebacterium ciconiae]WKD61637.1 putative dolichyl-phosphate-mannose--protein mannosyltransferase [Corynebacterium ciconiae DSM 44920]